MQSVKEKRELALNDEVKALWDAGDEKALASIISRVKPTQLCYIKSTKTSFEAWEKLKSSYKPKGIALQAGLIGLQMKEDGNVQFHLKSFSEIIERLAEASIELHEELLSIMLLCSLPNYDYENFVIAMETLDNLPTLSFFEAKAIGGGIAA